MKKEEVIKLLLELGFTEDIEMQKMSKGHGWHHCYRIGLEKGEQGGGVRYLYEVYLSHRDTVGGIFIIERYAFNEPCVAYRGSIKDLEMLKLILDSVIFVGHLPPTKNNV